MSTRQIYIIGQKHGIDCPGDDFQFAMFFGEDLRKETGYALGDKPLPPARLVKNVYKLADWFNPNLNFIVSERLKQKLSNFQNIGFQEVEFVKLFEYPYADDDFSHWDIKGYKDVDSFIKKLKNDKKLKDKIGKYYELLIPNYKDIVNQYNDLKEFKLSLNIRDKYDIYILKLSEKFLKDYPVFWMMKTICIEEIYEAIREYINPSFYYIKEYDLSEGPEPKSRRI
jgi:hypothetical protein